MIDDSLSPALQSALDCFRAGRYSEAKARFIDILSASTGNVTALAMLGRITALAGDPPQASAYFRRALIGRPDDAMLQFYLAITLHDQGKADEAIPLYRAALRSRPDLAKAHGRLALALQQLGKLEEALAAHAAALALVPQDAEGHNNLGAVLYRLRQFAEAGDCYRRAFAIAPHLASAHSNLGATLQKLGRLEDATTCYQTALAIAPGSAETLYNLGIALQGMKRYEEVVACFRTVLDRIPGHAAACNNLAAALRILGRTAEAMDAYGRATELDPSYAEAFAGLGILLSTQKHHDQALAAIKKAVALRPAYLEAGFALANSLYESGHARQAEPVLDRCLKIDPQAHAKVLLYRLFNRLPTVPENVAETRSGVSAFDELMREWEELAGQPSTRAAAAEVTGDRLPFHLAYRLGNHCRRLSRLGDITASLLAERWCTQLPTMISLARNRPRLLIVSGHFVEHSVWNIILQGLLTHLDRTRLEPVLLSTSRGHDAATAQATALAARFHRGSDVAACLRIIDEEKPEIIFYPEVGLSGLTNRLAHLRLAPLQAAAWGHPITTGSPAIDLYFSGKLIEPAEADQHYRERLIRLPGTGACTSPPSAAAEPLNPALRALVDRAEGPRYILCHTEFKHDPSHDDLYPRIASRTGRCRFFVMVSLLQGERPAQCLAGRFRAAFERHGLDPDDYLEMVPWQPSGQFYSLLDAVDIYLDCPAFSGYTTAWQAVHRGLPIVTLEGPFMRQRLAAGILRQMGCADTIASTQEEYIEMAARIAIEGVDGRRREARRAAMRDAAAKLNDNKEAVRAFERALLEESSNSVRHSVG